MVRRAYWETTPLAVTPRRPQGCVPTQGISSKIPAETGRVKAGTCSYVGCSMIIDMCPRVAQAGGEYQKQLKRSRFGMIHSDKAGGLRDYCKIE